MKINCNGVIREMTADETAKYKECIENYKHSKGYIKSTIDYLKELLSETDYITCKIAEGVATKEEYADVIAKRQQWRDEINRLETELREET